MRLRRKARGGESEVDEAAGTSDGADGEASADEAPAGPWDADELPEDDVKRVDLGALLIPPIEGRELRLQVDEKSGRVRAVMLAGPGGAIELRAYAAPRNGDLWSEVRPQIAADAARRGGTATEQEGPFGTELLCEIQVTTPDGAQRLQPSRVIGINGPRWLLRATLLGEPVREPAKAGPWEDAITKVAVRRGEAPMPVGEQLPLALPEGTRKVAPPGQPGGADGAGGAAAPEAPTS